MKNGVIFNKKNTEHTAEVERCVKAAKAQRPPITASALLLAEVLKNSTIKFRTDGSHKEKVGHYVRDNFCTAADIYTGGTPATNGTGRSQALFPGTGRRSQALFPFSLDVMRRNLSKRERPENLTIIIPCLTKRREPGSRALSYTRALLARRALGYDENLVKNGTVAKTAWETIYLRGFARAVTRHVVHNVGRRGRPDTNIMYGQATPEEMLGVKEAGARAFGVIETVLSELKTEIDSCPPPGRVLAILRARKVLGTLYELVGPNVPFTGRALDIWRSTDRGSLGDCPTPRSQEGYIPASEITRRNVDELVQWCEDNWREIASSVIHSGPGSQAIYLGDRGKKAPISASATQQSSPPADDAEARMLAADPTAAAIREAYAREQAAEAAPKPAVKKARRGLLAVLSRPRL